MKGFQFEIKGLDKLNALFRKLPAQLKDEVRAELELTANEIAADMRRDAPKDENLLSKSITTKKEPKLSWAIIAQKQYAGYQEFGTKSKAVIPAGLETVAAQFKGPGDSGTVSPIVALQKWVKRKGLAATYSTTRYNISSRAGVRRRRNKKEAAREKQIAFLIWRHIKKFGIKPQPFFYKQLGPAEPRLNQRIAAVLKRVLDAA